ncbi:MAG: hypothetical protein AAF770_03530 [Bacteroidota bacterium]
MSKYIPSNSPPYISFISSSPHHTSSQIAAYTALLHEVARNHDSGNDDIHHINLAFLNPYES